MGKGEGQAMRRILEACLSHGRRVHRIVVAIEPWGILLAAVALLMAVIQFGLEYEDRINERTVRAWQLVTTPASGNSGKIDALEYLNKEDGLCIEWIQYKKDPVCLIDFKPRIPLVGIDLSPRNTGRAGLSQHPVGVYLAGVNLNHANLNRANLSGAYLKEADLTGAGLAGAMLNGADLRGADLTSADLTSADLTSADLSGTNLTGAILNGADLDPHDPGRRGSDPRDLVRREPERREPEGREPEPHGPYPRGP